MGSLEFAGSFAEGYFAAAAGFVGPFEELPW